MAVDLTLVSSLAGTLKSAADAAKSAKDASDMPTMRGKMIEMQDLILSAQSATMTASAQLFELLQENAELKRKVEASDAWKSTSERYALKDYGGGTFAYELRAEEARGEPIHKICPVCFEAARRSVLQFRGRTSSRQEMFRCVPCEHDYFFGNADTSGWNRRNRNDGWV